MSELLLDLVHRHAFARKLGGEGVADTVGVDALGQPGLLPDLANHPALPELVETWWSSLALDLPPGWAIELPARCIDFFRSAGWALDSSEDSDSRRKVSVRRCRELLGENVGRFSEDEIRFLRDQLYALAEIVVDRLCPETQGGEE